MILVIPILSAKKVVNIFFIIDYLEYKGYKGSVGFSKNDNCTFGKV